MGNFWTEVYNYASQIDLLELLGLIFGLLAVWYLIKQSILTWPAGIAYILISFVIFWRIQLYGDFILHIFFLVLNVYGWYYWLYGKKEGEEELAVSRMSFRTNVYIALGTIAGVVVFGIFLQQLPNLIDGLPPAAVPFWDATTSILSVTAMWLTTRKKIENWYYWLIVDVLATGIYVYKGIHFYALLYGIYIIMAISGYLKWRQSMQNHTA